MAHPLRLITLNLKGLHDGWFDGRRHAVVEGLRRHAPDVVCLQEATLHTDRSRQGVYNQARDIGEAIGLRACAFAPYGNPIEAMCPDQGGLAVVTHFALLSVRNRRLPPAHTDRPDARVALVATLQAPFGEFDVVTTHLTWQPNQAEIRLVQMGVVLEELDAPQRSVLLGDMNATEDEPAIRLATAALRDCWRAVHADAPGHTWLGAHPYSRQFHVSDRRLDYAFCPPAVEVRGAEVILDAPDPVYPSDHFGLRVDLEWPP